MYMVLDTETCGNLEKKETSLVYDIGFAIVNNNGDIIDSKSLAISDYFLNRELMNSAYYKEKLPKYWNDIWNKKRELVSLYQAREIIKQYITKYDIQYVSCHNARFDYKALTDTQRYTTKSKYRYFLPHNIIIIDTLKLSRLVLKGNVAYNDFCNLNGYKTKNNQNRFTAEILYRFISGNNNFIEEHQGLDDVKIESEILTYCLQFTDIENGKLWA